MHAHACVKERGKSNENRARNVSYNIERPGNFCKFAHSNW